MDHVDQIGMLIVDETGSTAVFLSRQNTQNRNSNADCGNDAVSRSRGDVRAVGEALVIS